MAKYLKIAGTNLQGFGVLISGEGTYNGAARDVEAASVPGRNGDLLFDMGRYKNTPVKYPACIARNFPYNAAGLRAFLSSLIGYQRIEDGYHPEFYRMGRFVGPVEFAVGVLGQYGEVELSFDCKPQRFAVAGETAVTLTSAGEMENPYLYPALPSITVYGSGTGVLIVGNSMISIAEIGGSIVIDSDTMNAYKGTENKNNTITVTGGFPQLSAGKTKVYWTGGITKIEIIPRWWTI